MFVIDLNPNEPRNWTRKKLDAITNYFEDRFSTLSPHSCLQKGGCATFLDSASVRNPCAVAMKLTLSMMLLFASVFATGTEYITSVQLPDGTTRTLQDEEARREIQGILSQKYLKPDSIKAGGSNVFVTVNAAGEVTISAVTGTESDFTTNNLVLVDTIEAVAPTPGNYLAVSNAAMSESIKTNSLSLLPPFDFSSMQGMYLAVSNLVYALGGSITNFPPIP